MRSEISLIFFFFSSIFFYALKKMHVKKKWWKSGILFRWKIDQYFLKKFDGKKEISRFVSNGAWFSSFFFQYVVFQIFVVVRMPLRSRILRDRKLKYFTALNNVLASFHARIMRYFRLRVLFYSNNALKNTFWKFSFKKLWRHISVVLLLTFIFS